MPEAIEIIERRVRRLHVDTHALPIHHKLDQLLRDRGWQRVFSYQPYGEFDTPHGSFTTSDGILTAVNPRDL